MTVAALLAVGQGGDGKVPALGEEAVGYLEERIDAMQAAVPQITNFTIPGGNRAVSLCHVCRTVCRRAERAALRPTPHMKQTAVRSSISTGFPTISICLGVR